jgi:two-component system, NtrC family, sensor histidine kinase PilS
MILQIPAGRKTEEKFGGAWELDSSLNSFARLWKVFMNARVACASVLVILQAALQALGTSTHRWAMVVSIAYLCATLAVRFWAHPQPPGRTFDTQWIAVVGMDVIAFSLLSFLQPSGINYTLLFALPVLLASVLGPILLAFGTAASVTLLLLADAWWGSLQGAGDFSSRFLQAGLSSSGFFLVALLANQLALRLAREEQLLRKSQSSTRMQTEVNELVITTLVDGVLVMDADGLVRSANPAARLLLAAQEGLYPVPFKLTAQLAWQPLMQLMHQTFTLQSSQETSLSLVHPGLNARRLQVARRNACA